MMGNCYKLFINDRLYGIFAKEIHAETVAILLQNNHNKFTYKIQLAFVEGIGF